MKEEYKGGDCNINQKKKAETADKLEGKIYNYMFLLSLSALIDIYSVYSAITNILQIVNILRHERMDKFFHLLSVYKEMLTRAEIKDCPCSMFVDTDGSFDVKEVMWIDGNEVDCKGIISEVCSWPQYHQDVREVMSKGTYFIVPMGMM